MGGAGRERYGRYKGANTPSRGLALRPFEAKRALQEFGDAPAAEVPVGDGGPPLAAPGIAPRRT